MTVRVCENGHATMFKYCPKCAADRRVAEDRVRKAERENRPLMRAKATIERLRRQLKKQFAELKELRARAARMAAPSKKPKPHRWIKRGNVFVDLNA